MDRQLGADRRELSWPSACMERRAGSGPPPRLPFPRWGRKLSKG